MHFSPLLSQPPGSTGPCGGAQWLPAAKETCRRVRKWRNAERRGQPRPAALPPPVPERSAVQCRAVLCSAVLCCASPRRAVSAAPCRPQPSRSPSTAPDESAGPAACLPPSRPEPRTAALSPVPAPPPRPHRRGFRSCTVSIAPRDGRSLPASLTPPSPPRAASARRRKLPPRTAPRGPGWRAPAICGAPATRSSAAGSTGRPRSCTAARWRCWRTQVLRGRAGRGRAHRTAPHRCVPRRGSRRRGAQRAAGQPRRLPAAGRRLPGLRRRLLQVSASSWAPLRRKIDRSPGADGH